MGGLYDAVAGFADDAAGSVDESIGRTFDDREGGGVVDGAGSAYMEASEGFVNFGSFLTGGALPTVEEQRDPENDPLVTDLVEGAEGFAGDAAGAAGGAVEGAVLDALRESVVLQAIVVLLAVYAAGQLFDVNLGGGASA